MSYRIGDVACIDEIAVTAACMVLRFLRAVRSRGVSIIGTIDPTPTFVVLLQEFSQCDGMIQPDCIVFMMNTILSGCAETAFVRQ